MSAIFGKTWKINKVIEGTPNAYYALGGTVLDCSIDPRLTIHGEVGSEQRQLASHKVVASKPVIDITMNLRDLDKYIDAHAMITGEGAIPATTLYVSDGTEHYKFTGCKTATCRISIKTLESIKATLSILPKAYSILASVGTFSVSTEPAMYKNAVTTLTLDGTPITRWNDIEFGIDNHVLQEVLGTSIAPTEVEEQEATYNGHIIRARSTAVSSVFNAAYAGTPQTFVIALTNNATPPATKTYTFADVLLKTSKIEDRALGIVYERIEWEGKSLERT